MTQADPGLSANAQRAMLDINFTLVVQIANFAILMFLLNALLFKPILAFVARRREMIDETMAEARSAEREANETLERYQETLAEARRASDARFAEAQGEADQLRRESLAEAERQVGESISAAAASIRQASEGARGELRGQAESLAEAITEKVLGRND